MSREEDRFYKRFASRLPRFERDSQGNTAAMTSPDKKLVLTDKTVMAPGETTWDKVAGKPVFAQVAFSGNYADLTGAPAAFSGAYGDLTGRPDFSPVAASGQYSDLKGRPDLFSGAYDDLSGLPALFDGKWSSLTGKPVFAAVATSGSYADLKDKPTIPAPFSGAYADLTGKPVLFSGSYNDLRDRPTIPGAAPVRFAIRATTDATGKFVWTFPTAFPAGVVPVLTVAVQDATTVVAQAEITAVSNTGATIQVTRMASISMGGVMLLGIDTSSATVVHLTAMAPT
jgi:hypothetical protein